MPSKYFPHGTQLVYLDQCVVSRFVAAAPDRGWLELRDVLAAGILKGRLVVPHSLEHAVETAGMPFEHAIHLDHELRELSSGWCLITEPRLLAAEISAAVRKRPLTDKDFLTRDLFKPLSDPEVYAFLRETKESLDRYNAGGVAFVNTLNDGAGYGRRQARDVLAVMRNLATEEYRDALAREVNQALRTGSVTVVGRPDAPHAPTWTSAIVELLGRVHRFSRPELEGLLHTLATEGVAAIPFLHVKAALRAFAAWRGERIEPRDQYDQTRIACALPFADVLVTDGGVASALRELGLDQEFRTEVFSTKPADQPALISRLRALQE